MSADCVFRGHACRHIRPFVVLFYLMHVLCVLLGLNELLPNMLSQAISTVFIIVLGAVIAALAMAAVIVPGVVVLPQKAQRGCSQRAAAL